MLLQWEQKLPQNTVCLTTALILWPFTVSNQTSGLNQELWENNFIYLTFNQDLKTQQVTRSQADLNFLSYSLETSTVISLSSLIYFLWSHGLDRSLHQHNDVFVFKHWAKEASGGFMES